MTSNYDLFRRAVLEGKQVVFTYKGHVREACAHALGTKNGLEKVLTFQFAGGSDRGLPPGGQWRCLFVSEVSNVQLRDGPWHTGVNHTQPQTCIDIIDVQTYGPTPYSKRA